MKNHIHQVGWLLLAALLLGGCMAPNPYIEAPVVDKSVYRNPPPKPHPAKPEVQVTPLKPPSSFSPEPIGSQPPAQPPGNGGAPATTANNPANSSTSPTSTAPSLAPTNTSGQAENKAVVALLDTAANSVGQGDMDKAAASLERALRIEPRNPTIWHDLGQIRLHQGKYSQAEAMFDKSNSLAGSDRALQARNWRMIAAARRAGGDNAGADAATAKATQLEQSQ